MFCDVYRIVFSEIKKKKRYAQTSLFAHIFCSGRFFVGHLESECCRIGFKKSIFVAILILRRLGIFGATLIFAR